MSRAEQSELCEEVIMFRLLRVVPIAQEKVFEKGRFTAFLRTVKTVKKVNTRRKCQHLFVTGSSRWEKSEWTSIGFLHRRKNLLVRKRLHLTDVSVRYLGYPYQLL
jgi:hypothetical protein